MSFDEQPDGDIHEECAAEIHNLQRQLAESQAREVALRGLLPQESPGGFIQLGKFYAESHENFAPLSDPMSKFKRSWFHECEKALAQPFDDTALREWCAKLLEGVANEGEQWILEEAAAIRKEGFRQ